MDERPITPRGHPAVRLPTDRLAPGRLAPGGHPPPQIRSLNGRRADTIRRMITIRAVPVDAPEAAALLRSYLGEMVDRYHGRPMPAAAVDEALADEPADDVAVLLVAYRTLPDLTDEAVGCVGLRLAEPPAGEITKMYVRPNARRLGIGRRLLAAVERAARDRGLLTLRLDTRNDLVEARAMYADAGYAEIPPHRERRYADHWFAKDLATGRMGA